MPVAIIFEGEGVTQQQYNQTKDEVAPNNQLPQGMKYHVAGPMPNGWRVVEVWESEEALQRFFSEKLNAALQHSGITVQPQMWQVYNVMEPSAVMSG